MIRDITDRDFDRVVAGTSVPVLIEFWQPGCGGCRALMGELEEIQAEVGDRMLILKMNVQDNYQIPAELEISSLPALVLYRNGQFERFIGGIGKAEAILQQLNLPIV